MILYYPDQGILALFDSNDAKLIGDKVRKCFLTDTVHQLALWSPGREYTFREATSRTEIFKFDDGFPLLPLSEATNLDLETFFESFTEENSQPCLETPANLWPGQFE